ncbi:Fimbrial assembly protein (PilN) [Kingella potus]|uniref:Fimbrial assembly protein (PilN) n=1 Tax=Kingella potus TaxID=265175 RepID=A0A377R358_9NEIS|nr:PilN domain-containing protein [Kingella potus]UOP01905.1 PilN domain-containing protein [Kingella potus]STR02679.1 Fimbrial assembly protein (PilN) [Kingella potus]
MVELIKINLLPYREELSQKKKQKFKAMMVVSGLLGLGLCGAAYVGISQAISAQEDRNRFLESEIAKMDEAIKEIATLKAEKADFLAKKQKVEELQNKRFEGARIIDTLNQLLPEGAYINSISARDESSYEITGRASSDNRIAMFMRELPSTGIFNQPELLSIEKTDSGQKFVIKTILNPSAGAPLVGVGEQSASSPANSMSAASSPNMAASDQNSASGGK